MYPRLKLKGHEHQLLLQGEIVEKEFMQRRLAIGGSLMNPTSILATNKRLLIIHRATMGMRMEYEIIPYIQIVDVTHNHGMFSSSVFIHMQGYHRGHNATNKDTEEGEVYGLSERDADELVEYIEEQIASLEKPQASAVQHANAKGGIGAYVYCASCGNKNGIGAEYCEDCGTKLIP